MLTAEELKVILTGLDLVTIQGKSAKLMVDLQTKVEKLLDIELSKNRDIPPKK
ncbi:hypothetical protein HN747_05580 [archaeon]|jgi:hypothetical protein|nr:hypothetical protein [archaeon]